MIDRQARNKLAEQIRHFMSGLSDNLTFDNIVFNIETDDVSVKELRQQMWHTYDDFSCHKLRGKWQPSTDEKETIKRFMLFLKTDMECVKISKSTNLALWPFENNKQYMQAINNPRYLNNAT